MKDLKVSVEFYQDGKDMGKIINGGSLIEGRKKGLIIISFKSPTKQSPLAKWTTEVGGNISNVLRKRITMEPGGTMISNAGTQNIKAGKSIKLGVMVSDPDATGFWVNPDVYHNPSALKQLTSRYKYVYLVKCKFTGGSKKAEQ